MQQIDQLITARWVLPIAPKNTILNHHAVAISDGKIVDVLPTEAAKERYEAKKVVDRPNHILMPGMINTHTHTSMNLFRGLADDLELMDWLNNYIWPAEAKLITPDTIKLGSKLAIAEMIRGGTTCFNDHYLFGHLTAEVAKEVGMRASIGFLVMDVENQYARNGEEGIKRSLEIYENRQEHDLITWTWAPQGPYTVTDPVFKKIKTLADETNLKIHLHLHETQDELNIDLGKYGKRPIQRLHDMGILSEKLIAVHMVHISDEEMQIVKDTGTHVVHCPASNLKLASGFAPIKAYLENGVNVALGTDGAASNNDLDMLNEMHLAALVSKCSAKDPTTVPAPEAVKMATLNGAIALGLDNKIGSLEAGKYADLIAVDTTGCLCQPVFNPFSHLAYSADRDQVSDVWVAGETLLENKAFTKLNEAALLKEAEPIIEQAMPFRSKASIAEVTA